tara:strand:- start:1171 stop:1839 length:669 start_codon:yes stop_codon:yes gene_type:complete
MNLKERIQDIFHQYSVQLELADKDKKEDEVQMAKKTLANGTVIYTDAEDFAVGVSVFIVNDEGERMPLPDGEYEYEGGGKTVVAGGKIAEMVEAEEEKKEEEKELDHTPDHKKDEEEKMEDEKKKDEEEMEEEEEEKEKKFTKKEVEEMVKKAVEDAKEKMASQLSKTNKELSDLKEMLSTQKAEAGLRRSASKEKRMSFADIKKLTQKERVSALYELYSNK